MQQLNSPPIDICMVTTNIFFRYNVLAIFPGSMNLQQRNFGAIQSSFDSQLVPRIIITTRMSFVCEPEHASLAFSVLFGEITSDTSKNYIVEYNRWIWALEQHHDTLKAAARKNFHHFKHWNCFVRSQCCIVCIRKSFFLGGKFNLWASRVVLG